MARLLCVYHSKTGGTRQMVEAAVSAGRDAADDLEIVVKEAPEATPYDLLGADGYLFATPENLAAIAGVMKAFFDATYYPVLGKVAGRPYAALICAGSDGESTRSQLERICTGWRLKKVADTPIVCTHAQTKEEILAEKTIPETDLERCREIGATLAAGLEMGVF